MATEASTIPCPGCKKPYEPTVVESSEIAFCPQCRFPLTLLAGKYRLERLLNQGGFGMLYLARHVGLDQFNERVIKVLKPELFAHLDVLHRFRREVQLTARLSEQNNHIVRIYDDFGEAPGLGQYYVMEFLRGVTLDALQEVGRPLSFGLTFHIFYQLCKAMGASHRAGVIHRDLKPDNLFLIQRDADPHFVKVIDFGLARPEEGNTQMGSFATQQQVMGTPAYMSPEQCQGEEVDNRSDIYAMGILLYQMLSGHHPFPLDASDTMALFFAHISGDPTPLSLNAPALPKALGGVVAKALAKQPDERYPDAEAFWEALLPFAPDGSNYASLIVTPPHYATTPSSSSPSTESSLDPLAFEATAAVLPAISGNMLEDLVASGTDFAGVDPTNAPMTIEISGDAMDLPSASPHDLVVNDTRNHRVEAFATTDAMPLVFDGGVQLKDAIATAKTPVVDEADTDDAANHAAQSSFEQTSTADDDDPYFDDDDDDATSISEFVPPTGPPPGPSPSSSPSSSPSPSVIEDDFFDDDDDDDGDTSISTAPHLPDAATEDVPTLGQEMAAVPASEMPDVLAANTTRSHAVATPPKKRAQRSRPISETIPPPAWGGAPPTIDVSDLEEDPRAGVNIPRPTKIALSQEIDPTVGDASDSFDEKGKQPWALWIGVILAILGIVGVGIWLLTHA